MAFSVQELGIAGCMLVSSDLFEDPRGSFFESYSRTALQEVGIPHEFVQDNQSLSVPAGTVRGLHLQAPPHAQAKLVRVLRGAIFDVAVDIRHGSATYGQHVSVTLRAGTPSQVFIPEGFAHGFCTLEPETEVFYKVSAPYAPNSEYGVLWNDPALAIDWPVQATDAVLSDRDKTFSPLADLPTLFKIAGDG